LSQFSTYYFIFRLNNLGTSR